MIIRNFGPRLGVFALLFLFAVPFRTAVGGTTMVEFVQEADFSIAGTERDVGAIAWSPDGGRIAVLASLLRYAMVFAVPSGQVVGTITDLAGAARAIDFAADGRVLIPTHHADAGALTLWDPNTGSTFTVPGPDPSTNQIVTNLLFVFVLDPGRTRLVGLHYVKQGAGMAFRVAVYDTKSWQLLADHSVGATGLAMSPDGSRVAAIGQAGQVNILDTRTGETLWQFQANMNVVQHIAWSPDGKRIATGTMSDGFGLDRRTGKYGKLHDDDTLQLWNAETGGRIATASQNIGGGVESLEFSRNGTWLVTTTSDGTCRLWDATNLDPRQIIAEGLHPTTALARFSPDSRRLAVIRTGLARATIYRAP
jgi:WD40 repeat protein